MAFFGRKRATRDRKSEVASEKQSEANVAGGITSDGDQDYDRDNKALRLEGEDYGDPYEFGYRNRFPELLLRPLSSFARHHLQATQLQQAITLSHSTSDNGLNELCQPVRPGL